MIKAATLARFNYAIKRHFFHVKMSLEKKGILKVRPQLDCAGSVTPRRESRQVRLIVFLFINAIVIHVQRSVLYFFCKYP